MLFQIYLCRVILILSCVCLQPKDTQQALSRKESAVNMEKFKKFAARRKWKVRFSFIGLSEPSFCSLPSQPGSGSVLNPVSNTLHFLTVTLWPSRKERERQSRVKLGVITIVAGSLQAAKLPACLPVLLAGCFLLVCLCWSQLTELCCRLQRHAGIVCLQLRSTVDCSIAFLSAVSNVEQWPSFSFWVCCWIWWCSGQCTRLRARRSHCHYPRLLGEAPDTLTAGRVGGWLVGFCWLGKPRVPLREKKKKKNYIEHLLLLGAPILHDILPLLFIQEKMYIFYFLSIFFNPQQSVRLISLCNRLSRSFLSRSNISVARSDDTLVSPVNNSLPSRWIDDCSGNKDAVKGRVNKHWSQQYSYFLFL